MADHKEHGNEIHVHIQCTCRYCHFVIFAMYQLWMLLLQMIMSSIIHVHDCVQ